MEAADDYCKVEIRKGTFGSGSPDELTLVFSGAAGKGQTWRSDEGERICARRSGYPANCSSGLTPWVCISPYKDIGIGNAVRDTF